MRLSAFQSTLPARGATERRAAIPGVKLFQSTLPARGATQAGHSASPLLPYFNPRSPHGERLISRRFGFPRRLISIHAPRTGSDGRTHEGGLNEASISIHAPRTGSDIINVFYIACQLKFQSTLPARGATAGRVPIFSSAEISIHAPRTGSDWTYKPSQGSLHDFNPRSPHGERRIAPRSKGD